MTRSKPCEGRVPCAGSRPARRPARRRLPGDAPRQQGEPASPVAYLRPDWQPEAARRGAGFLRSTGPPSDPPSFLRSAPSSALAAAPQSPWLPGERTRGLQCESGGLHVEGAAPTPSRRTLRRPFAETRPPVPWLPRRRPRSRTSYQQPPGCLGSRRPFAPRAVAPAGTIPCDNCTGTPPPGWVVVEWSLGVSCDSPNGTCTQETCVPL